MTPSEGFIDIGQPNDKAKRDKIFDLVTHHCFTALYPTKGHEFDLPTEPLVESLEALAEEKVEQVEEKEQKFIPILPLG